MKHLITKGDLTKDQLTIIQVLENESHNLGKSLYIYRHYFCDTVVAGDNEEWFPSQGYSSNVYYYGTGQSQATGTKFLFQNGSFSYATVYAYTSVNLLFNQIKWSQSRTFSFNGIIIEFR